MEYLILVFDIFTEMSLVITLMNFLTDTLYGILERFGPVNDSQVPGMVPRVKPLFYISEEEIMMYTYFADIPHFSSECPYAPQSPNTKLKGVLNELETSRRGNMISLMRRFQKVMKPVIRATKFDKKPAVNTCQTCGMTSLGKICSFCRTITTLQEQREQVQLDEL
jgi:uncharacterized protein (TIGR00269 family)